MRQNERLYRCDCRLTRLVSLSTLFWTLTKLTSSERYLPYASKVALGILWAMQCSSERESLEFRSCVKVEVAVLGFPF